jgi:hypothetical protein
MSLQTKVLDSSLSRAQTSLPLASKDREINSASPPPERSLSPIRVQSAIQRGASMQSPVGLVPGSAAHVKMERTECKKGDESDEAGPVQFKELAAPVVKFPLWLADKTPFLSDHYIGAAILELLGVNASNYAPEPSKNAFPKVRITKKEGFEVLFFNKHPKANASALYSALKAAGCTTANIVEHASEREDGPVGRVTISSPNQYLAFLAVYCRLNHVSIANYLISQRDTITPGIHHLKSRYPFVDAIREENLDLIDYDAHPDDFHNQKWPEAFKIVEAFIRLCRNGIIR